MLTNRFLPAQKILVSENLPHLEGADQGLWLYNGLDCATTLEIWENIKRYRADQDTELLYSYTKGMRAAAMTMTFRGIRVDTEQQMHLEHLYSEQEQQICLIYERVTEAICGTRMNPRSPKQVAQLLYSVLRLPEQKKYDKATKTESVTTNIEALEKLQTINSEAHFICGLILKARETRKKLGVVRTGADPDGRMRFSFNVAGPNTGRWSSNENPHGTGTNGQNITDEMRRMFVADPGFKLGNIDLGQADSRGLGYMADDARYIEACEGPDLHTAVAMLIWKDKAWPEDWPGRRKLADELFWRHFSHRDISKRGGHAANYMILAQTMSQRLKLPLELCKNFILGYYQAFPGIQSYHSKVQELLATSNPRRLYSPSGRRRFFFGSPFDNDTLRQAVAHLPQSLTGDVLNIGLFRVQQQLDPIQVQLLAQIHDAILFQYPAATEQIILPKVISLCQVSIPIGKRALIIPGEMKVGWNWGSYLSEEDAAKQRAKGKRTAEANLYGLRKWSTGSLDKRVPPQAPQSMLDYVLR